MMSGPIRVLPRQTPVQTAATKVAKKAEDLLEPAKTLIKAAKGFFVDFRKEKSRRGRACIYCKV
jgi:hypothetical protein